MSSTTIVTITKMIETLPESAQEQAVEHLREFIAEIQDETRWDNLFKKTQKQLVAAARRAREEIAAGHAKPMDYDQL
jgi:type I site-specific restriction endonuclease